MATVDLQDNSASTRKKQKEVHPLTRKHAFDARTTRVRVVVQVHLRDQRRSERILPVPTGVGTEEYPFGFAVDERLVQSFPQVLRCNRRVVRIQVVSPPGDHVVPGQAGVSKWPVVEQAVLTVLHDLDHVVDRVAKHNLRFRPVEAKMMLRMSPSTPRAPSAATNLEVRRRPTRQARFVRSAGDPASPDWSDGS